jgi:protein-S-isoprenylcysteine O-methyltransferase Ste14
MLPSVGCAVAAWFATRAWPEVCLLRWPPQTVLTAIGAILLALGVPLWLAGVITVRRAYNRDQLRTTGVFSLVRHPVYSSWIVFVYPGLAVLLGSWPMLAAPLVGYVIFKRLIRREDDYLEQRFGQAYLDYRARVNEVCPFPWLWK